MKLSISALLLPLLVACQVDERSASAAPDSAPAATASYAASEEPPVADSVATFAGGCFWCMEKPFERLPGVSAVISGYTGGHDPDPTYREIGTGRTGHTESVQIHYDSSRITYDDLLQVLWRQIDPTDLGGQFVDRGSQYRPEIFTHTPEQERLAEASRAALEASGRFERPVAIPITPASEFYPAEDYHQDYYLKSPDNYYRYRRGSGRDAFLDRVWGDEREYVVPTPASSFADFEKPSEAELRERLTDLQFRVTQEDGTERAFSNEYWDNKRAGIYVDIVSGEPLFSSRDKYDSRTGWPSFTRPLVPENIHYDSDRKLGYVRTEVRSTHADSHLGHVFDDGPPPTGKRYCINSAALRFVPADALEAEGYGAFLDDLE